MCFDSKASHGVWVEKQFIDVSESVNMRILHILNDGPRDDASQIIAIHMKQHELEVIDLSAGSVSYADLVDKIEEHDQVICW